jgi:hypothetical protein
MPSRNARKVNIGIPSSQGPPLSNDELSSTTTVDARPRLENPTYP